ncbi:MAG: imidazolonepropionase [Chloroflexi bacterium]|nr:imidazolonepropionase [Chloroflexota bacterium]
MLIIHNAGQLCTMPLHDNGPQRGKRLGDVGLIEDGAIAIRDGNIADIGTSNDILTRHPDAETVIDAGGKLVTPGLVDPHTHVVWAGNRASEFERRIAGATYQEIMAEGGGIAATMRDTRAASLDDLIAQSLPRLLSMMRQGATTIECKSGYGLDTQTEIKILDAIVALNNALPVDLVPTFLGAHALPPEYRDDVDGYVDLVVNEMLPAVTEWKAVNWADKPLFCDVFCETGAFSLDQSRHILETAKALGFDLKIHADEFDALGGTALAVELGAASADHLVATTDEEIKLLGESDTVATSLPPTPFGLGHHHFTRASEMLAQNAVLAIATDCNPGTAWCESLQLSMAIATRYLKLTQAQALAACTVNSAFAIKRGGQVGTLQPGALGDVVIWQVDDYRMLGYRFGANLVDTVIKRGEIVHSYESG